jgi:hypothetical protein
MRLRYNTLQDMSEVIFTHLKPELHAIASHDYPSSLKHRTGWPEPMNAELLIEL